MLCYSQRVNRGQAPGPMVKFPGGTTQRKTGRFNLNLDNNIPPTEKPLTLGPNGQRQLPKRPMPKALKRIFIRDPDMLHIGKRQKRYSAISILFSIDFSGQKTGSKNRFEINSTRKVYPFIIHHSPFTQSWPAQKGRKEGKNYENHYRHHQQQN